jgi:hypothetical protein
VPGALRRTHWTLTAGRASGRPNGCEPREHAWSVRVQAVRVVPTGGQVEPSAQLKAVPIGYNPFFVGALP